MVLYYRITSKKMYQITENASLEDFQQRKQLKWISHVTQRENNDIITMLTFHTPSNKRLRRKSHQYWKER